VQQPPLHTLVTLPATRHRLGPAGPQDWVCHSHRPHIWIVRDQSFLAVPRTSSGVTWTLRYSSPKLGCPAGPAAPLWWRRRRSWCAPTARPAATARPAHLGCFPAH